MHVLNITFKDLKQIVRDGKAAIFLLIMPIAFTLFFGFIFQGGEGVDNRLPVGLLDEDGGDLSPALIGLFEGSTVLRMETYTNGARLERDIADEDLAAGIVIPAGFSASLLEGIPIPLVVRVDPASTVSFTIQAEAQALAGRLLGAARIAGISAQAYESTLEFGDNGERKAYIDEAVTSTLLAWQDPPVALQETETWLSEAAQEAPASGFAHTSPGMMAQFSIAGLMGAAGVIVRERKTRSLQRLLTTSISRFEILFGHYLAIFLLILAQFIVLIAFGQIFLGLRYDNAWGATLLMTFSMAACCASMGLLIGVLSKTEEHTIIYTLVPMFVFAGLGGAWVPLEYTSQAVQAIGHLSPVAWMMDGFSNILVRGQGLQDVLLPAAALLGFTCVFLLLAVLPFRRASE